MKLEQTKTNDFKWVVEYEYGYKRLTIFHKKKMYVKRKYTTLKQKSILSNDNEVWLPIEVEINK